MIESVLDKRSDFELLELIKKDRSLFEIIYRRYVTRIYRYCYNRLGYNNDLAEDIVSETFLKAIKAVDKVTLDEDGSLLPWLYTIARNTLFTYIKKSKKSFTLNEDFAKTTDPTVDLDQSLDNAINLREIKKIMQTFPEKDQDLIYLKIFEEMTFVEISKILNMGVSATKMRYYRLLKKIQKQLSKNEKRN